MSARRIRRLKIAWFPAQKSLQVICNRNLAHSFSPASLKIFIFRAGSSNFKVFDFCFPGFFAYCSSLAESSIDASSSLRLSKHLVCLWGSLELFQKFEHFQFIRISGWNSFGECPFRNSLDDVPGLSNGKLLLCETWLFELKLLSFFGLLTLKLKALKLYNCCILWQTFFYWEIRRI